MFFALFEKEINHFKIAKNVIHNLIKTRLILSLLMPQSGIILLI